MIANNVRKFSEDFPNSSARAGGLTVLVLFPSPVITDHLPHGDGRLGWGYVNALAGLGCRVHLAARSIRVEGVVPGNVTLHTFPAEGSGPGSLKALRFMFWARRLLGRLQEQEPIHLVHELNPVYTGLSLVFAGCGVPLVLGPIPPAWPARSDSTAGEMRLRDKAIAAIKKTLSRLQQSHAAAVLPMGAGAMDRIYVQPSLCRIVQELPPGVDVALFAPQSGVVARPQSVLFLANLAVRKGILTLLEAMPAVIEVLPQCTLTIAGGGEAMDEVVSRVRAMPFGSRISVLGPVQRAQVPFLMASHSVYCLPSYGDPFPGSVLEAMSCGKPVILTATSGLRSLITPEAGRLVPERNAAALADAIIELLSNPLLLQRMGEHNRNLLLSKCSWDSVSQALSSLYRQVLRPEAVESSIVAAD